MGKYWSDQEIMTAKLLDPMWKWIIKRDVNEVELYKDYRGRREDVLYNSNEVCTFTDQLITKWTNLILNRRILIADIARDKCISILTKEEYVYIWNIIKPFAQQVYGIQKKRGNDDCWEYLRIYVTEKNGGVQIIKLPQFHTGEMYVKMERDIRYDPRELLFNRG